MPTNGTTGGAHAAPTTVSTNGSAPTTPADSTGKPLLVTSPSSTPYPLPTKLPSARPPPPSPATLSRAAARPSTGAPRLTPFVTCAQIFTAMAPEDESSGPVSEPPPSPPRPISPAPAEKGKLRKAGPERLLRALRGIGGSDGPYRYLPPPTPSTVLRQTARQAGGQAAESGISGDHGSRRGR